MESVILKNILASILGGAAALALIASLVMVFSGFYKHQHPIGMKRLLAVLAGFMAFTVTHLLHIDLQSWIFAVGTGATQETWVDLLSQILPLAPVMKNVLTLLFSGGLGWWLTSHLRKNFRAGENHTVVSLMILSFMAFLMIHVSYLILKTIASPEAGAALLNTTTFLMGILFSILFERMKATE